MRLVSKSRRPLNVMVRPVDTPGMIDFELELIQENPSWIAVLKAYQAAQEELAARLADAAEQSAQSKKVTSSAEPSPDSPDDEEGRDDISGSGDSDESGSESTARKRTPRWVQRITRVPGIDDDELSKIHGRLIAYDLLKCDLAGRADGMVYQLTSSGRSALARIDEEVVPAAA